MSSLEFNPLYATNLRTAVMATTITIAKGMTIGGTNQTLMA
jgi:hypothetical protein